VVRFQAGAKDFPTPQNVQIYSGNHPASYSESTRNYSLGVTWPICETKHAPQSISLKVSWRLYL